MWTGTRLYDLVWIVARYYGHEATRYCNPVWMLVTYPILTQTTARYCGLALTMERHCVLVWAVTMYRSLVWTATRCYVLVQAMIRLCDLASMVAS